MADLTRSLVLLKGLDVMEAIRQFEAFVKGTGGNEETIQRDRDFFDQWERLTHGEGVLFTRERGTSGVMRAFVITAFKVDVKNELRDRIQIARPRS